MTNTDTDTVSPSDAMAEYLVLAARRAYAELIDTWNFADRPDKARECAELAVKHGIWDRPLQRPREYLSGLGTVPIYDAADFWFTEHLERNADRIRAEVESVLASPVDLFTPSREESGLVRAGEWDQVYLCRDGVWEDDVCAALPVTTGVIGGIPEAASFGAGVVALSRLAPGTHVTPHCGPSNAILRVHLGLKVPDGTSLRVGDELTTWTEGKCLVFDDGFEHEVWHRGSQDRIVLILDVLHPALRGSTKSLMLAARRSAEEQVLAFMRDHGLARIDATDGRIAFQPNTTMAETARAFVARTGITRVDLTDNGVHWYNADSRDER
jgi:aspartyl/asparaginyl beta-hydroxylase (cupin superfamily)